MKENFKIGVEIEKKYIIAMPDLKEFCTMEGYSSSQIEQIYLPTSDGSTHRVRRRTENGRVRFTETRKVRIDEMSATEIEGEISEERYLALSANPKEGTVPINKVRHKFFYLGQMFEIDIYPAWKNTAIMETELDSRERVVEIPKFLKIIRDVTGDKRYSNAAMSHSFPKEDVV